MDCLAMDVPPSSSPQTALFNQLSPEVIGKIFIVCKHIDASSDYHPFINIYQSQHRIPMLLTQVCKYWRDIALSVPTLWDSFCLEGLSPTENNNPLLELWLLRSKDAPLSIAVNTSPATYDGTSTSLNPTPSLESVALLSTHAHRWRLACFRGTGNPLVHLPSGTVSPSLEHLAIIVQNLQHRTVQQQRAAEIPDTVELPNLATLPKLSQLYLVPGRQWTPKALLQLPFSQLTHVFLCAILTPTTCLSILSKCQTAIVIDITSRFKRSHPISASNLISLPCLRSLTLSTNIHAVSILEQLHCPALCFLKVNTTVDVYEEGFTFMWTEEPDIPALCDFICQCPSLEQVVIRLPGSLFPGAGTCLHRIVDAGLPGLREMCISSYFTVVGAAEEGDDTAFGDFGCPVVGQSQCRCHVGWTGQTNPGVHLGNPLPDRWQPRAFWECAYMTHMLSS